MKSKIADERIKEKSKELFFTYGLKSVSMDDVARVCGMSKKSIYQYFDDKNALVHTIVHELIQSHQRLAKICRVGAKDAIDEVIKHTEESFEIWAGVCPVFFYELEKSFPEAWRELQQYRLKMHDGIVRNLEWGMGDCLYRTNINAAFVAEVRLHELISFFQRDFVAAKKWSIHQSAREFTSLHLHSITTEEGKKRLCTYFAE